MPGPEESIDDIRKAAWDRRLASSHDGWFSLRRRELLAAAQATPLRMLFPYTSHNSLHFSRCSSYPFTHDCPWIWFSPAGRFVVYPPHPSLTLQGNLADPLPPPILDTRDVHDAVNAVVRGLPPNWHDVWVGSIESRPDHPPLNK